MQKIKKAYKNKSYVLLKNAINLKSFGLDFDFNSLFEFYNTYPIPDYLQKNQSSLHLFQVMNVVNEHTSNFFNAYLAHIANLMKNIFKYKIGNLDFFFSTKPICDDNFSLCRKPVPLLSRGSPFTNKRKLATLPLSSSV